MREKSFIFAVKIKTPTARSNKDGGRVLSYAYCSPNRTQCMEPI